MIVRIKGSTTGWRDLFIRAVGARGRTVILSANVDIDLTNLPTIPIVEGVTITSEADPPGNVLFRGSGAADTMAPRPSARSPWSLGPRLFTRSRQMPLFEIRCNGATIFGDNVRIHGFRIEGPHMEIEEGADNLERGIMINSCVGIEIFNMELSGWSGQAIYIVDDLGRITVPDHVRIHDNFIHNNQHRGGNGYGVETSTGAFAAIERNVFDNNRHAVSSSGADQTGYRAHMNLVLSGGGHHDTFLVETTHQFDVHGDANCPDVPLNQHTWNCGNAGSEYWITSNAFQFRRDNAIKLRGKPRTHALISGNFFSHTDLDDAVSLQTTENVTMTSNTVETLTENRYGVCDFDGDGKDDLFLATGASWWYSSAGHYQWTFLGPNTEFLDQVGLGYFDADRRCDVFTVNGSGNVWGISSGGRGPWTRLPGDSGIPLDQLRFGDFNGDGRTDVFRREPPHGQWWAISPGVYGWTELQSSGFPLSELRFGDFDGNGVTDVLSRAGGHWSVSWGARSEWRPLNTLSNDIGPLFIANVDGLPGDDLIRFVPYHVIGARWDVSSGGQGPWTLLTARVWPNTQVYQTLRPGHTVKTFVGRFNGMANSSLLTVDFSRRGKIFTRGYASNAPYGHYPY